MSQPAVRTGADMFGATMLFSLLLHGVVILGITFTYVKAKPSLPTLDVTLVDVANREVPDKADFLAQANNSGGGESDKAARPSQPISGDLPRPSNGVAPKPIEASAPRPQEATNDKLLTTTGDSHYSVNTDSAKLEQASQDLPDSPEEVKRKQEMAQLAAEVRNKSQQYAKRPKKKFVSPSTKEDAYAAYLRYCFDQIVKTGNLNYPSEARRQRLYGDVLVTLVINKDGGIKDVQVIQSSGKPLLDTAALRIIHLAGPFPSIPKDKDHYDELYMTRYLQFLPGDSFNTR